MDSSKHKDFITAYNACHEPFVRYCSALAYGKMDTEDLVQDVLLSAYTHFDKIENLDQFLHYLIRAARNRSISNWRKKKYKTEILDQHAERLLSKEISPEDLLDVQLLYKTMDRLPEKQKNALVLFEISGFSMKEIADIQNSTEGAIKTKISRGRKKLKQLLGARAFKVDSVLGTLKSIAL